MTYLVYEYMIGNASVIICVACTAVLQKRLH